MSNIFRILRLALFFILFCEVPSAQADLSIVRGPYLQKTSSNTSILRWRTNSASSTRVRYGKELGNLSLLAVDETLTTEHRLQISGLDAGSRYYYAIDSESGPLLEANEQRFFETNPPPGETRPVRVWVLGDSGRGNENQRAVYRGFQNFVSQTKRADLMLMLGDNAYDTGLDSEYQTRLFDIYEETLQNTTLWPTFGNHDGQNSHSSDLSGPYYDSFSLPRQGEAGGVPSGTEAYYSFDYGPIHFICLNSYDVERGTSGAMANWLRSDLAASNLPWKIAYWHHPPYSKGSHDSDTERELVEMRENIVPLLEDGGVDLVLSGHSHSYERSKLVDGHYGPSGTLLPSMILDAGSGSVNVFHKPRTSQGHRGTVYMVAGNAAVVGGGALDHPIMARSSFDLGSLVLDVESSSLDVKLIGTDASVKEAYRIQKDCYSEGPCPSLLRIPLTPIAERTLLGSRVGNLRMVQRNDRRYEILRSARVDRRGTKYGLIHRQEFLVPPGLATERVLLILQSRRNVPMKLRFSFSLDGQNFRVFAERETARGFLNPLDLSLPFQLTGRVWLQIETVPLSPRFDRLVDIRMDQAVLY